MKRLTRWYQFMGSAVAWFIHFISMYILAEFSCVTETLTAEILGISVRVWLLLLLTALFGAVAIGSCLLSLRELRDTKAKASPEEVFLPRAGYYLGLFFSIAILFQGIPTLFLTGRCG